MTSDINTFKPEKVIKGNLGKNIYGGNLKNLLKVFNL